tara:strand:- start:791 stop:901 length:111 start_codon:yes stop_codon:yes gene_type:complete
MVKFIKTWLGFTKDKLVGEKLMENMEKNDNDKKEQE